MAAIVNYIDWVTLSEAKTYLRVDDGITNSDLEITMMINAACELIQNYTQVYFKPQTKTYFFSDNGVIRIYDNPITSITEAAGFSLIVKQLYTEYCQTDTLVLSLEANIGFDDTDNIKDVFKYGVLETVKLWFYGSESESTMKGYLPSSVLSILAQERRFIF
jgi:hypothetical protein